MYPLSNLERYFYKLVDSNTINRLAISLKVKCSDESGQNLNLVKPTQYQGKSYVNSGHHFRFRKCRHILSICHLKYFFWISVYTFFFQNGHVMTSTANHMQGQ